MPLYTNYAEQPGATPPPVNNFMPQPLTPKDTPVDQPTGNPTGGIPNYTSGPDTTNTGGFDIGNFLTSFLGNGKGGMSSFLPALAQAYQQYRNAGKYTDLGNSAANMANPMGDRSYYVDQLAQSYKDPTAFLNEPGNQAAVKLALQQTQASDAAQGYLGSGRMMQDLADHAQTVNQTYLQKTRDQLGQAAGIQFDPANAAQFIMQGGKLSMDSENKALDSLFTQFNQGGNGSGGGGKTPVNTTDLLHSLTGLSTPAEVASQLARYASMAGGTVKDLWNYLMTNPNTDDATRNLLTEIGQNPGNPDYGTSIGTTGGNDPWVVTNGALTDQAPPDYNQYSPPDVFNGGGAGIDWSNPGNVDWGQVNFSNFTSSDWDQFSQFFGDGAA